MKGGRAMIEAVLALSAAVMTFAGIKYIRFLAFHG